VARGHLGLADIIERERGCPIHAKRARVVLLARDIVRAKAHDRASVTADLTVLIVSGRIN
jgi:hypothetical protein